MRSILLPLVFVFAFMVMGRAQVFDEKFEHWPLDLMGMPTDLS